MPHFERERLSEFKSEYLAPPQFESEGLWEFGSEGL